MFSHVLSAIAALLLLPLLCQAAAVPSGGNVDPKCPHGSYAGFEASVFQYDVPATKFFNKMGSFLHSEWYTGPLDSTKGKDNTVGSTRSGNFSGTLFTERLVGYSRSATDLSLSYVLDQGPVTFEGVKLFLYTEELGIESICGGRATFITFTAIFCEAKPGGGYDFYDRVRRDAVGAVATELGAKIFAGSCPVRKD